MDADFCQPLAATIAGYIAGAVGYGAIAAEQQDAAGCYSGAEGMKKIIVVAV